MASRAISIGLNVKGQRRLRGCPDLRNLELLARHVPRQGWLRLRPLAAV
jgi:hypothetical protein